LDSSIDAAINFAFIAGVTISLLFQGDTLGAIIGAIGLGPFAAGLPFIGCAAKRSRQPFTFDGVKDLLRARETRLM
jgi:hypothetical protein